MIQVKIINKQNIETFGTILENQNEIQSWLELIGESKGKPERWVIAKKLMENGNTNQPEHWMWHSEYYEESDVLKTEERTRKYIVNEINELGHTIEVEKEEKENWVLLKADYTIEIIDLNKDYDYLLNECYTKRRKEYGDWTTQLEEIYDNVDEWKKRIIEIKRKYPKPNV